MRSLVPSPTAAALACFVFLGCKKLPVAPVRRATPVPLADAVSNTVDRNISITDFPGCDGDVLSGTATENTAFSASNDGAGGFHINHKDRLTNMRLTGSPSGAS